MRFRSIFILTLLPFVLSCASLAAVTGQVVPGRGQRRTALDQVVVYVEAIDPVLGRSLPPGSGPPVLAFTGQTLAPRVEVLRLGSPLRFRNDDLLYHRPFSRSPAAPFDLGSLGPKQMRLVKPKKAGVVQVYCQLHGREVATVLVLGQGTWTRPDARGRFRLSGILPGTYRLCAWHPELGERSMPLKVERPGTVAVELRYPVARASR